MSYAAYERLAEAVPCEGCSEPTRIRWHALAGDGWLCNGCYAKAIGRRKAAAWRRSEDYRAECAAIDEEKGEDEWAEKGTEKG